MFWIGIGHAGTLISAILFLTRQKWRTSINRAAEAMTLFAVICAGIFPGIHVGRVWMAWYLAPVPNSYGIWPNFRSPLLWDVFAVSTYFTVSVLFWYTGLVPDLATLRDRAKSRVKKYHLRHLRPRLARLEPPVAALRNGLSAPRGPLHAAGALRALGRVLRLRHVHPARLAYHHLPALLCRGRHLRRLRAWCSRSCFPARLLYPQLDDMMTRQHVDKMAKIILLTGSIVGYAYFMELFIAYYGAEQIRDVHLLPCSASASTTEAGTTGLLLLHDDVQRACAAGLLEQVGAARITSCVFIICMFVNAGMWFERFVIIVTSLAQDFLPSSWRHYHPSWVEIWTFIGTFGIFLSLFLLFMRFLPMICHSK